MYFIIKNSFRENHGSTRIAHTIASSSKTVINRNIEAAQGAILVGGNPKDDAYLFHMVLQMIIFLTVLHLWAHMGPLINELINGPMREICFHAFNDV